MSKLYTSLHWKTEDFCDCKNILVTRSYHVSIVLGIIANHVTEIGRHIRSRNRRNAQDFLVGFLENCHGVSFATSVDLLVKCAENDLPEVKCSSIGFSRSYQLVQQFFWNRTSCKPDLCFDL